MWTFGRKWRGEQKEDYDLQKSTSSSRQKHNTLSTCSFKVIGRMVRHAKSRRTTKAETTTNLVKGKGQFLHIHPSWPWSWTEESECVGLSRVSLLISHITHRSSQPLGFFLCSWLHWITSVVLNVLGSWTPFRVTDHCISFPGLPWQSTTNWMAYILPPSRSYFQRRSHSEVLKVRTSM